MVIHPGALLQAREDEFSASVRIHCAQAAACTHIPGLAFQASPRDACVAPLEF
jgi:hypothetical protein